MKIALILPNNVWFCPYASIYGKLFEKIGVKYDIISWNRSGKKENAIQYNYSFKSRNPLALLLAYKRFASFVITTIKRNGYNKLIVFTSQSAIFLSDFLKEEYKGNYIFDYRDLSIEQNYFFKKKFKKVLGNSFANVISSPGFKKYLPNGFNYILSHNFDIDVVRNMLDDNIVIRLDDGLIDVLTIGGIRDYESNVEIIKGLSNIKGFSVRFIGEGPSAERLKRKAKKIKSKNITFEGYYSKEREKDYVEKATFLNIFYPRKASHDTALSNRFYNSLIYGKPMITTANTTQGDYAENNNVGVALKSCENLPGVLRDYLKKMDVDKYLKNRKRLLSDFLLDYKTWESIVKNFVNCLLILAPFNC